MQRKVTLSEGEFYHIYNRGVEKRKIFSDNHDRERLLRLLYIANSTRPFSFRDTENRKLEDINRETTLVAIGSYCLMPNHFHLLVREITAGGTSLFMEKLSTGYSMYFNKKHSRVGPLFQGRFKVQHVHNDEHLKYLFAYIHLNPVKLLDSAWKENGIKDRKRAEQYLSQYRYSSYLDYSGVKREEVDILDTNEFPRYFASERDFNSFVEDWLNYSQDS